MADKEKKLGMEDIKNKYVLTPQEASCYVDLSEGVIRSLCEKGEIKATRIGHKWKIPRVMLERYMIDKAEKGEPILWTR
jgi:excisionase family DNA binding protein